MAKQTDDKPAIGKKEEIADEKLDSVAGGAIQMDTLKATVTETPLAKKVVYK